MLGFLPPKARRNTSFGAFGLDKRVKALRGPPAGG
jgi:hypothetical protein